MFVMASRALRIGLLTPELAGPDSTWGGLGIYVYRMAKALGELGHQPEVFVTCDTSPAVSEIERTRIVRVKIRRSPVLGLISRASRLHRCTNLEHTVAHLKVGLALGRAFRRREREVAFDLVQCSDFGLAGLFVPRQSGRPLIVRCSWMRRLYAAMDGVTRPLDHAMLSRLELLGVGRADAAYAPSRSLATLLSRYGGLRIATVRPPADLGVKPAPLSTPLPERFLVHFGQIGRRKGSDVLADALSLAWREEPAITMVWAGREIAEGEFARLARSWGDHTRSVRWLGELARPELYGILTRSLAAVLPSRIDNLPNTATECALLGVPIVASAGASLDEIVDHEANGLLAPIGDAPELARALVRVWRGLVPWRRGAVPQPAVLAEMEPRRAVDALLRFAGAER